MELCDNGRRCGIGKVPICDNEAVHWIQAPGMEPIKLCELHFRCALAAGLVEEPFLEQAEFDRRERVRIAGNN